MEQGRVNLLSMFRNAAWRQEHHNPPQLNSKENLPLTPPQVQLISNITEPQIAYFQGKGAKERAASGQVAKQKLTETKKDI